MRSPTVAALAATCLVLLAAGCGDDDNTPAEGNPTVIGTSETATPQAPGGTGAEDTKLTATLTEYGIDLDMESIDAGGIEIVGSNEGKVPHEIVLLKTDTDAGDLKVEGPIAKEEGENLGEAEGIAPGADGSVQADLDAGHYILICNLPTHYEQGMHANLTVN